MSDHIVSSFDEELNEITDGLINMGALVLAALKSVEEILKNDDHNLAQKIIDNDLQINNLGQSIEIKAFNTLASRQPMAFDLRLVFSAVKMSLYLERCGDMCKGISKRILKGDLTEADSPNTIDSLVTLTNRVHENLSLVLEDYAARRSEKSLEVWSSDSEIDSIYSDILMEILNNIKSKPEAIEALVPLFFIARYLERVGDQATNIAEVTHFIVTGEVLTDEKEIQIENETTF